MPDVTVRLELAFSQDQYQSIVSKLDQILQKETRMAKTLDDLEADVQAQRTVIASAVAAFAGIAQQLRDAIASNNPARISALADSLEQNTNDLAAAVVANTPGGPVVQP